MVEAIMWTVFGIFAAGLLAVIPITIKYYSEDDELIVY